MSTNVTPGERQSIRMMYLEGFTIWTIVTVSGRSRSTVKRVTKDLRQAKKNAK